MLICVTVLILKHDLFNYFHIGNVSTQNNVDEPGPQLVVEPPPQGLFPLSVPGPCYFWSLNSCKYLNHRISTWHENMLIL